MDLSTLTVSKQRIDLGKDVNWNQMSDRQTPAVQKNTVPSRGNSVKYNLTSMRPGCQSPGGVGVDIKHGSYARYLSLKKSYNLRAGVPPTNGSVKPIWGNKTYSTNAVAGSDKCVCVPK